MSVQKTQTAERIGRSRMLAKQLLEVMDAIRAEQNSSAKIDFGGTVTAEDFDASDQHKGLTPAAYSSAMAAFTDVEALLQSGGRYGSLIRFSA